MGGAEQVRSEQPDPRPLTARRGPPTPASRGGGGGSGELCWATAALPGPGSRRFTEGERQAGCELPGSGPGPAGGLGPGPSGAETQAGGLADRAWRWASSGDETGLGPLKVPSSWGPQGRLWESVLQDLWVRKLPWDWLMPRPWPASRAAPCCVFSAHFYRVPLRGPWHPTL